MIEQVVVFVCFLLVWPVGFALCFALIWAYLKAVER